MRKITLFLAVLSIVLILHTPKPSMAEYNPTTGRFLQRDPIGINDEIALTNFKSNGSPKFSRIHNAHRQYADGMILYEYVKSKPISAVDPMGLDPFRARYTSCGNRMIWEVWPCAEICQETVDDPNKWKGKWESAFKDNNQKHTFIRFSSRCGHSGKTFAYGFDPSRSTDKNKGVWEKHNKKGHLLCYPIYKRKCCKYSDLQLRYKLYGHIITPGRKYHGQLYNCTSWAVNMVSKEDCLCTNYKPLDFFHPYRKY